MIPIALLRCLHIRRNSISSRLYGLNLRRKDSTLAEGTGVCCDPRSNVQVPSVQACGGFGSGGYGVLLAQTGGVQDFNNFVILGKSCGVGVVHGGYKA